MTELNWPQAFAIVGLAMAICAALCVLTWLGMRGPR